MRKLNLIKIACMLIMAMAMYGGMCNAQLTTTVKKEGNEYVEVDAPPATVESLTEGCDIAPEKYRAKDGTVHTVYVSANRKPFIVVKAKSSGNLYRRYLTEL